MKAVRSAEGGQQGCVLATNGCCLPYQKALRKTQLKYPKAEFVIQADDTSIRAASADAENVHKALKANRKALCNTVSNVKKVKYFRPGGGVEGIPAEQLEMQGGELVGLKLVGVYLAPDTEAGRKWQRDNLSADFTARFSVLERVDQASRRRQEPRCPAAAVLDDALPQLNAVLLDAHNVTRVWSGQCSRKWWSRRSRSRSCSWLRRATARRS